MRLATHLLVAVVAASSAASAAPVREPPPATSGPVDGLVSAPGNFKLLLENDRVRVLRFTLLPGALDHWHTHPPRVGYVLSGSKIRVTEANGSHEDYDEKAGEVYWADFSPLHDTYNLGSTPFVALLVEVKGAPSSTASPDEAAIRAARNRFTAAITAGDLGTIASALDDKSLIVTGANSLVFAGRAEHLRMWKEDLAAPSRGIYVRTPDRIEVSPVGPMAFETGHWNGVDTKSADDWSSGVYSAKWRKVAGAWKIEVETYMTTACGGRFCPKPAR